ncbi:MAG TPA: LysR family transcriptional regulator [Chthoniobacterales bacterium]
MHEYTSTTPFDLFELHLLHLVAEHGSFTKVASLVGLTQSAITRQIQGMEARIGLPLLDRTTRQVRITPAGDLLLRETRHIVGDIESSLRRLREEFGAAPKVVRIGVSKTVGLAYLPGFFFANQRKFPEVALKVQHDASSTILADLEAGRLDVAVVCPPEKLPESLLVRHRFDDAFTLIVPAALEVPTNITEASSGIWTQWLNAQSWLHIHEQSNTGRRLREWISKKGGRIQITNEADNFDLIISLVALGLGVSLVPQRALANYPRKRAIRQIVLPERFTRSLVVLVRRSVRPVAHVEQFVETILF